MNICWAGLLEKFPSRRIFLGIFISFIKSKIKTVEKEQKSCAIHLTNSIKQKSPSKSFPSKIWWVSHIAWVFCTNFVGFLKLFGVLECSFCCETEIAQLLIFYCCLYCSMSLWLCADLNFHLKNTSFWFFGWSDCFEQKGMTFHIIYGGLIRF